MVGSDDRFLFGASMLAYFQGLSLAVSFRECNCYVGVSKNNGTPKSSILRGFSIINHPFWGTPIFGNIHLFSSDFFDKFW